MKPERFDVISRCEEYNTLDVTDVLVSVSVWRGNP